MRKPICLALALVLSLCLCTGALAAPFYLESAGVTIEVPDGMTGTDASDDEKSILSISVDDDDGLKFAYLVSYIDELEGKYIEDLTDEEAEQLGMGIGAALDNPQFSTSEIDGYPVLVVANGEATQLHYISLLNGWLCDVAVGRVDGSTVQDSDIEVAVALLDSITFDGEE